MILGIAVSFIKAMHLIHDWRHEIADLDRVGSAGGWTEVRECRTCKKVERHVGSISGDWWESVTGMELVDLRRAFIEFRRRWIMVGGRRVRHGRHYLKATAALRDAERWGLR